MRKNISDKLPTFLRDAVKQSKFLFDPDKLQLAKSNVIFDAAVKLFMEKWRQESEDLIEYFESQWVQQNRNWFEGFRKHTPSTNNALESFNRLIKDEHTLRERMDLGKFRVALFEMVKTWSLHYATGIKVIAEAPEVTLVLWTEGYNWAKSNIKITSRRHGSTIVYRSSTADTVHDSINWQCFDNFKDVAFNFYDTSFNYPVSRENWLSAECDCGEFFKLYMCRHIIGIALRMKCTNRTKTQAGMAIQS